MWHGETHTAAHASTTLIAIHKLHWAVELWVAWSWSCIVCIWTCSHTAGPSVYCCRAVSVKHKHRHKQTQWLQLWVDLSHWNRIYVPSSSSSVENAINIDTSGTQCLEIKEAKLWSFLFSREMLCSFVLSLWRIYSTLTIQDGVVHLTSLSTDGMIAASMYSVF